MIWKAVYEDGTYVVSTTPNAYANLDRNRLIRFEIYGDDIALAPVYTVDIPKGSRFVYRGRHQLGLSGERAVTYLLALESRDRREVDLHMLRAFGDYVQVVRQPGYGPDAESSEPPLFDHEVCT